MKYVSFTIYLMFVLLFSQITAAEEHLITQKDLKFIPIIKVVKPGDSVKFQNNDNVVHNIISQTDEFEFNLGEFKPGMTKSVKFKQKGVVDVECTVHPDMKMTIFVF
ncbi:cupredoxin domain-containing protein [Kaarinaea lacus]